MIKRAFGSTGLAVSALGLGCNNFGGRLDLEKTKAVVDAAIDTGVNFIDTAPAQDRLDRRLLLPPPRSGDADRGDAGRARRPRAAVRPGHDKASIVATAERKRQFDIAAILLQLGTSAINGLHLLPMTSSPSASHEPARSALRNRYAFFAPPLIMTPPTARPDGRGRRACRRRSQFRWRSPAEGRRQSMHAMRSRYRPGFRYGHRDDGPVVTMLTMMVRVAAFGVGQALARGDDTTPANCATRNRAPSDRSNPGMSETNSSAT